MASAGEPPPPPRFVDPPPRLHPPTACRTLPAVLSYVKLLVSPHLATRAPGVMWTVAGEKTPPKGNFCPVWATQGNKIRRMQMQV